MNKLDKNDASDPIRTAVRPFAHQVAGHSPILLISDSTICKPYDSVEGEFYANPPEGLSGFIPRFHGSTDVRCEIDPDGHPVLTAEIPEYLLQTDRDMKLPFRLEDNDVPGLTTDFSVSCIRRIIDKKGHWSKSPTEKYIMLENVLSNYLKPCLLDIKLGTSNLQGNENEAKRKLLQDRINNTTSGTHGLRLHGMHVLRYPDLHYEIRGKDWGREKSTTERTLRNALMDFVDHEPFDRSDVFTKLCGQLTKLITVVSKERTYTLCACSLLVVYEGSRRGAESVLLKPKVELKLIDFSKTRTCVPGETDRGGVLFGLTNLLRILDELGAEHTYSL